LPKKSFFEGERDRSSLLTKKDLSFQWGGEEFETHGEKGERMKFSRMRGIGPRRPSSAKKESV